MKLYNISKGRAILLLLSLLQPSVTESFVTSNLPSIQPNSNLKLLPENAIPKKTPKSLLNPIQRTESSLLAVSGGAAGGDSVIKAEPKCPFHPKNMLKFADKNFFVLGMAVAVWLAKTVPHLGMDKGTLRPEIFIGKYGVTCIFLLSGLSLELSELKDAAKNHKLNGLVQATSFLAWPLLVGLPLVKVLELCSLFTPALRDGILILTTLPTTVNMCVLLTSAANGNVASALCNAVLGNTLGVFATPALLLRFFGTSVALPFVQMVGKLSTKVMLPVVVGQLLRKTPALSFYKSHSKKFKRFQETILLGIVWNAFSNAFAKGLGLEMGNAIKLLVLLAGVHLSSIFVLFKFFQFPKFNLGRREIVAATFCASHKTLAFGLPLIKTVFDGNPNLASYCAPIMLIHPLQLILGSLTVPEFSYFTKEDEKLSTQP